MYKANFDICFDTPPLSLKCFNSYLTFMVMKASSMLISSQYVKTVKFFQLLLLLGC